MLPGIMGVGGMMSPAASGPTDYPFLVATPPNTITATNPINVPYPGGLQANDIAFIEGFIFDSLGGNGLSAPAGWDVLCNESVAGLAAAAHGVFGKRLTGSETGTVALSCTGAFTGGSDTFYAQMSIWRGCKTTGAYYEAVATNTGGVTANMQAPAVTTTGDYRLLCHFGSSGGTGVRTATPASGYTEQWDQGSTSGGADCALYCHTKQILHATAEGAATHTLSGTSRWHECAFALIPVNG